MSDFGGAKGRPGTPLKRVDGNGVSPGGRGIFTYPYTCNYVFLLYVLFVTIANHFNLDTAPEPPFRRGLGRIYGACGTAAEPPETGALKVKAWYLEGNSSAVTQ